MVCRYSDGRVLAFIEGRRGVASWVPFKEGRYEVEILVKLNWLLNDLDKIVIIITIFVIQ